MKTNMNSTLIGRMILTAVFLCIATPLVAQNPAAPSVDDSSVAQTSSASSAEKPLSESAASGVRPVVPSTIAPVQTFPSHHFGGVTVNPGVISDTTKMKMGPNYDVIQRYGAAPAVMNFTFGRR